jgi:hypothetical protein
MRFRLACLAAIAGMPFGTPVCAAWNVAQSKHFVIYADENAKKLTEFATRLERFDQAVRHVRGMDDPPVGTGNRLTVFVMPNIGAVQKLMNNRYVGGFYIPRASGSYAFVPRSDDLPGQRDDQGQLIFFHEYSHHLMFEALDKPLPEWVVEGFAEFMSTARFEKDGSIGIGIPAYHRAYGLVFGDQLPLEKMLGGNYSKISPEQRESIYGRGWLLVHYLTFEKSRAGQLDRYANLMAKGIPGTDAARTAFGDLHQLDKDMRAYLGRSNLMYLKLTGNRFQAGPIEIRPLADGASKVVLLRAQSKRGVDQRTAEPLAVQVRAIEARYPGDELVELTLAEAEIDSGHFAASQAAADRALKASPGNTKAMVLKGRAIEGAAQSLAGDQRHAAFEQARKLFIAANRIDTEDPEPLMEFYKSFVQEGIRPTDNAIAALHYASDLAPQDRGLRMNSAAQYLAEGKYSEAKDALTLIAYDPHGGDLGQAARAMIERIDAGDAKDALAAGHAQSSNQPGASQP